MPSGGLRAPGCRLGRDGQVAECGSCLRLSGVTSARRPAACARPRAWPEQPGPAHDAPTRRAPDAADCPRHRVACCPAPPRGPEGVWETLRHAKVGYVLAAGCALLVSGLLRTLRWRLVLRPIVSVRFAELWFIPLASNLINYVIPLGTGDVARSLFLRQRWGTSLAAALAAVVGAAASGIGPFGNRIRLIGRRVFGERLSDRMSRPAERFRQGLTVVQGRPRAVVAMFGLSLATALLDAVGSDAKYRRRCWAAGRRARLLPVPAHLPGSRCPRLHWKRRGLWFTGGGCGGAQRAAGRWLGRSAPRADKRLSASHRCAGLAVSWFEGAGDAAGSAPGGGRRGTAWGR